MRSDNLLFACVHCTTYNSLKSSTVKAFQKGNLGRHLVTTSGEKYHIHVRQGRGDRQDRSEIEMIKIVLWRIPLMTKLSMEKELWIWRVSLLLLFAAEIHEAVLTGTLLTPRSFWPLLVFIHHLLSCASKAYAFKKLADSREKHQWHHMVHNLWKMLRNFASCHMEIILGERFYHKILDATFFIRLVFGRAGFFLTIIKNWITRIW